MKKLTLGFIFCASLIINVNPSHAILGGLDAKPEAYKYLPLVALLTNRAGTMEQNICTGTLINKNTVLTAAHCFKKIDSVTNITLVRALYIYAPTRVTQPISKSQIFIHPNYSDSTKTYDFAVIKLNQELAGTAQFVYPELTSSVNFEKFIFWGYGLDENTAVGTLKSTFKFKDKMLPLSHGEEHFIKFDQTDLHGVSGADSGGPVITVVGRQAYLVAINTVVTSQPNGLIGSSKGFMTKVAVALDWIKSYM